MQDFLVVNLFLTIFLVIVAYLKPLPKIHAATRLDKKLSPRFLSVFILCGLILILTLLLYGASDFVSLYIRGSFSLLVIGGTLYFSLSQSSIKRWLSLSVGALILALRFLFPTSLTHNLFLITALFWLGQLFTSINLLTRKRLVVISLLWFVYDVLFVWLTPLSKDVQTTTEAVGFPLAILWGDSFLGSADLLWASLFLSQLSSVKQKVVGASVLIVSNLLLGLYTYVTGHFNLFPLLVLWVPLGLFFLYLVQQKKLRLLK